MLLGRETQNISMLGHRLHFLGLLFLFVGAKLSDSLGTLRKQKYLTMAATSKKGIQPEKLPPTDSAAKYHSLRVYLQVMQWMGFNKDETKWGWKKSSGVLIPIMTDKVHK